MPVSLFYHYADVRDPEALAATLRPIGSRHGLSGRIRVSTEGVNGTFGGSVPSVHAFHAALLDALGQPDIEFKVSEGSAENFPGGWRVRVCKEIVTMGVPPEESSWRDAAPHLEPEKFRDEVLAREAVVLDVRNQYEHAIGRFRGAVLPPIRQFSDFPEFADRNRELFRGRRVLMYCTGGIRCERASSYLKKLGVADSIAQLQGGIDRFLHTYPCGGDAFEGKNLVFDTRMAVSTSKPIVVGHCICCNSKWDDYSSNMRCSYCRSRVLVCENLSCPEFFRQKKRGLCVTCSAAGRPGTAQSGPLLIQDTNR